MTTHGVDETTICRTDEDYELFVRVLDRVVQRAALKCHGLCVMGTHFHFLVETLDGDLATVMEVLNGRYSLLFNRRHGRRGHLFRARYFAGLIRTEPHLLESLRYMALNPVRAGLCRTPESWPWGTYRATLGLDPAPAFLTTEWVLAQFGSVPFAARLRFRSFVHGGLGEDMFR